MTESFVPILLLIAFGVVLATVLLGFGWFFGRHQRNPSKLTPYEGGVPMLDATRKRINVRFYKVAMSFIIFDIEAAFIYPWAVIYKDATLTDSGINWLPFWAMMIFTVPIAIGFIYEWKKGAFDWT